MTTSQDRSRRKHARDRGRVLLVSDDSIVLYQPALTEAGLEVVEVTGGAAALVSVQRSRPHLVIAGTTVEGIRPEELARTLGNVPLILIGTARSTNELRREALAAGAFDYFEMPAELETLVLRAKQLVAITLTMERLRADSDLDSLTGLANRRRFRAALVREVERWRRYSVPCALILLDIDHLKAINDRYGHPAGDQVIQHVAYTLAQCSRDNDTASRMGGEEFALLLAGLSGDKAAKAAERLRRIISEQPVEGVGRVTVSIGVAACPEHAVSERTLYAASDAALYVAKTGGRNRVSVAPAMVNQDSGKS